MTPAPTNPWLCEVSMLLLDCMPHALCKPNDRVAQPQHTCQLACVGDDQSLSYDS